MMKSYFTKIAILSLYTWFALTVSSLLRPTTAHADAWAFEALKVSPAVRDEIQKIAREEGVEGDVPTPRFRQNGNEIWVQNLNHPLVLDKNQNQVSYRGIAVTIERGDTLRSIHGKIKTAWSGFSEFAAHPAPTRSSLWAHIFFPEAKAFALLVGAVFFIGLAATIAIVPLGIWAYVDHRIKIAKTKTPEHARSPFQLKCNDLKPNMSRLASDSAAVLSKENWPQIHIGTYGDETDEFIKISVTTYDAEKSAETFTFVKSRHGWYVPDPHYAHFNGISADETVVMMEIADHVIAACKNKQAMDAFNVALVREQVRVNNGDRVLKPLSFLQSTPAMPMDPAFRISREMIR